MKVKINVFAILVIILAIWLGITGRVDWWVIILVALSHVKAEFTI